MINIIISIVIFLSIKMSILLAYFYWHYLERPKDLFLVMSNYVNFWVFFFSVNRVLKSLFAPWKKIEYATEKNTFDIVAWLDVIFSNIFSRTIGFIMRLFLLCVFVIFEVLTMTIGILSITFWILMPIIFGYLLFYIFFKINV